MTVENKDHPAHGLDIGNVIAAFSEEQVARLVGLTTGRLRYWARTGFFEPSFVEEGGRLPNSRFYSFKDVVALRTLEMLRVQNGVPLQHLRKVAEKLAHLKDELWTETKLYVFNKRVIFVNPETETPQDVVSGQYLLGIKLAEVINDTRNEILAFRRRPGDSFGQVSRNRSVARNAWVVSGTRIPVGSIIRLTEDGYTPEKIISEYPDLTLEDIEAALRHGRRSAA